MSWSVLQSVSGFVSVSSANSATVPMTATTNLTSGSKLLAFYNLDTSDSTVTWAANDGNGNNLGSVKGAAASIGSGHNYIGVRALDTPVGDVGTKPTVNIVASGASHSWALYGFLLEVTGLVTGVSSAILDGTAGVSNWTAAASATDATYSSTASSEFLIQFLGDAYDALGPGSYTAPTGYTSSIKFENTSTGSGGLAWKNSTGGSEAGADWTANANTTAMMIKVAFQLATAPTYLAGTAFRAGAGSESDAMVGLANSPTVSQGVRRGSFY